MSVSENRFVRQVDSETCNEVAVRREALAIIGIGCRFPGGANDTETYWSILHRRRCAGGSTARPLGPAHLL